MAKTLHLTIKKEWFDMIKSGEKTEEYREIKPYWQARISPLRQPWIIRFQNGRGSGRVMYRRCVGIDVGIGRPEWGAPDHKVYIIRLGKECDSEEEEERKDRMAGLQYIRKSSHLLWQVDALAVGYTQEEIQAFEAADIPVNSASIPTKSNSERR